MNALLEGLHDIEGLDFISRWPLAIGWWIVIASAVFIGSVLVLYVIYRIGFKRSWKNDTLQKLDSLENKLTVTTGRETVVILSEYLRRIALRRFSRKECASLTGDAWLKWLATHDPKKFDWAKKGIPLVDIPYAPVDTHLPFDQVKDLIQAVREWVR